MGQGHENERGCESNSQSRAEVCTSSGKPLAGQSDGSKATASDGHAGAAIPTASVEIALTPPLVQCWICGRGRAPGRYVVQFEQVICLMCKHIMNELAYKAAEQLCRAIFGDGTGGVN